MRMRRSFWRQSWRWMAWGLALAGLAQFSGCASSSGGSATVPPADATVTAIVQTLPSQNCSPSLAAAPLPATIGSPLTLAGACWKPGETVTIGVIPRSGDTFGAIDALGATATVGKNGSFAVSITLTTGQLVDVWDAHLPIVAYGPSFVQFAALSVVVSS